MLQKLALTAASAVAALTLAVALAAAGFAPGAPAASTAAASPATDGQAAADSSAPDAVPTVQVDTVYVKPAPKQKTITVHKIVRTSGGGEGENESGGDD